MRRSSIIRSASFLAGGSINCKFAIFKKIRTGVAVWMIVLFIFRGEFALARQAGNERPATGPQNQSRTDETADDDVLSFLPEGSIFHFRSNDTVYCFLPQDMEVQGIFCRGGGHDWHTGFYMNGQLALIWPARDQEIQGWPCRAASFWTEAFRGIWGSARVRFHENGRLKRCKLAEDISIGERCFNKGDIVRFDCEGRITEEPSP